MQVQGKRVRELLVYLLVSPVQAPRNTGVKYQQEAVQMKFQETMAFGTERKR